MRISKYDVKEWMQRVYTLKGTKPFKMEDLPPELNVSGMPRLAWNDCLLQKVKKGDSRGSTKWVWQINPQSMRKWS